MAHDTTLPAPVCALPPGPPRASLSPGGLSVAVDGQHGRVGTARWSTPWLPDTPSHRHLTPLWCRLLVDAHGQPLCTWQA
jgi:hypothetical protein